MDGVVLCTSDAPRTEVRAELADLGILIQAPPRPFGERVPGEALLVLHCAQGSDGFGAGPGGLVNVSVS